MHHPGHQERPRDVNTFGYRRRHHPSNEQHESFGLLYRQHVLSMAAVPRRYDNRQRIWRHGSDVCPSHIDRHNRDEFARMVCPHHYVKNVDHNRVPSTLVEAECSCSRCLFTEVSSFTNATSFQRCTPSYYYVRVLRRVDCVDNVYVYRVIWEPLVVGCKCSYPQFAPSTLFI